MFKLNMGTKGSYYAFIDCQNLYKSIRQQGWYLSYQKFRQYLSDKYGITKAFIFVGYLPENEWLYSLLKKVGYTLVFKPTLRLADGTVKGNVDAELVLHAMIEYSEYSKALIVTGDGDFCCLVEYLVKHNKLLKLMIPSRRSFSSFLIRFRPYMAFMNNLKEKLEYKKEREYPSDGTLGVPSHRMM